jgi:hypothetical protein
VGEKAVLGPDWVHQTRERVVEITKHMSDSHSMKKSYINPKRLNVEFQVYEEVLLGCHLLKVL